MRSTAINTKPILFNTDIVRALESEERKMVDIKGLDKARVLKALYDHSHPQGFCFLQLGKTVMLEECAKLLEAHTYFDYLGGRVLKVDLSGDEFDPRLYDRDCGEGAAQRAVDSIHNDPEFLEGWAT